MPESDENIPLRDAEAIVDVLNEALQMEGTPEGLNHFLLRFVSEFLSREGVCTVVLLHDLDRKPAPRVVKRYMVPTDATPIVTEERLQEMLDELVPLVRLHVPRIKQKPRQPVTVIASEDVDDRAWFENQFRAKYLEPAGLADSMISAWAPADDRAIAVTIHRRETDRPFSDQDRMRMSLLVRAVAPLIDRQVFGPIETLQEFDLTPRQREVLGYLLAGDSEKDIARKMNRSVNTVHTHVKQLYDRFNVSSRGQLMANFLDRALMHYATGRSPFTSPN